MRALEAAAIALGASRIERRRAGMTKRQAGDAAVFAIRVDAGLRYLRARRKEGFISVIAGFSFLGIMLGVATLIIVMAVMNGFRKSCSTRFSASTAIVVVHRSTRRLRRLRRGRRPSQAVAGRQARDAPDRGPGAGLDAPDDRGLVRGMREDDLKELPRSPTTSRTARSTASTTRKASRSAAAAEQLCALLGDNVTLLAPRGAVTPSAPRRASSATRSLRSSRSACRSSTPASSSCRSPRRRTISTSAGDVHRDRGRSSRTPTTSSACAARSWRRPAVDLS